jgi:hypothetical protein
MMGNGTGDTEALREEIRRTRVELGETMEALAAKADVRARLRSSAEQARQRMRGQAARALARARGQATQQAETVRAKASAHRGELRDAAPWAALAAGATVTMIALLIIKWRQR